MQNAERKRNTTTPAAVGYEAPRIELILSQEGMEREVHYAGFAVSPVG